MQTEQTPAFKPALTLLNMSGDITITWDESNRDDIIELVRKKMNQGYSFFVITPRAISLLGNKTVKLKDAKQLNNAVGVVVPDAQVSDLMAELGTSVSANSESRQVANLDDKDVEAVVRKGKAQLHLVPKSSMATTRRAKTPEEVVENQTVAMRPISGG